MDLPFVQKMCHTDNRLKQTFQKALLEDHRCHLWGVITTENSSQILVRVMNYKNGYYSFIDVYSMCSEYNRIEPKYRIPTSYLLHETEFIVNWVGKGPFRDCDEDMHGCELENEYIMLFEPNESFEEEEENEEEEPLTAAPIHP